jgi:amino acid transporter
VSASAIKLLACISIILFMNYIAYRGIEASARLMILLSVVMLLVVGLALTVGVPSYSAAHIAGFTMQWGGILLAVFFLSETFYGWEAASFMAEETEDAQRTIPRAIVMTSVAVAVIALLLTAIVIGVLGIEKVSANGKPLLLMLQELRVGGTVLLFVNLGIVVAFLGNASGNIVGLPRLLLAMSRDKLFIEQFADIHPVRQTPYKAIIFQTIIAVLIVFVASGAYQMLLELLVPVSLFMYAGIIVLVSYFRWTRPEAGRTFKVPFGSFLPLLIGLAYLGLLGYWAVHAESAVSQLRLLGTFLFFSVPIYLVLTYFYDPDQLIGTMNVFSRLNLLLENVFVPRRVRHEMIDFFRNAKDKRVLEFGSGVGTLTVHMADHVGEKGKVYAVSMSASDVVLLRKRMEKLGHGHVEVIHDPHLVNRVHPDVKSVDIIVSIGHLSYLQDVKKVLKEMSGVLTQGGHVFFIEYVDMFYFLPDPKWLSDPEVVRQMFNDAGFSVTVKVKRGLFWKYLQIYGIKESRGVPYI